MTSSGEPPEHQVGTHPQQCPSEAPEGRRDVHPGCPPAQMTPWLLLLSVWCEQRNQRSLDQAREGALRGEDPLWAGRPGVLQCRNSDPSPDTNGKQDKTPQGPDPPSPSPPSTWLGFPRVTGPLRAGRHRNRGATETAGSSGGTRSPGQAHASTAGMLGSLSGGT